jgi:hypothetical protein
LALKGQCKYTIAAQAAAKRFPAKRLTKGDARRVAANVAKLPELLQS